MAINTYLLIIAFNVNGVNASIKRHRAAEWIRKKDPYICCLLETHLRMKDTRTESKEMENDTLCKLKQKTS